jgi:FtsP/CotA-like multicopper oxidase with cupredoxin domain
LKQPKRLFHYYLNIVSAIETMMKYKLLILLVALLAAGCAQTTGNDSSIVTGGAQEITIKVVGADFVPSDITVQKGIPVRLNVDGRKAMGCMTTFLIPSLNIRSQLKAGDNYFEFTPTETITIPFSCGMNMARGVIRVVEGNTSVKQENQEKILEPSENLDGLSNAGGPIFVDLQDGQTYPIEAREVKRLIDGKEYKAYAYNGNIPGPIIRAKKGSILTIPFTNNLKENTTIHWHGLRHDVKMDGVPGVSQPEIAPGETFTYTIKLPDAGTFWYHPHVREDRQQDMGLAGIIVVTDDVAPVNKEEILVLDDLLIENGKNSPYLEDAANFAIMGRFGNTMLVNGKTDYTLRVSKGDVIRFTLVNVANVRPYNISFSGAQMKLVGSDMGHYEREQQVNSVTIAPAERYTVDILFDKDGEYFIENNNPLMSYKLGKIIAQNTPTSKDYSNEFSVLKTNTDVVADIAKFSSLFDKEPDYTLKLDIDMPGMMPMGHMMEGDDIEWEDTMFEMNKKFTSKNLKWFIENENGKQNMDFMMNAKIGDVVKIRFVNNKESMHPMQHPMHLHGQRFLVTQIDGEPTHDKVWKDTVLVPIGSTVDILVDVTNPGEWMMHCHIAEHLTSGMMTSLEVKE